MSTDKQYISGESHQFLFDSLHSVEEDNNSKYRNENSRKYKNGNIMKKIDYFGSDSDRYDSLSEHLFSLQFVQYTISNSFLYIKQNSESEPQGSLNEC